jgi:Fe2+ transport system protein FeoA
MTVNKHEKIYRLKSIRFDANASDTFQRLHDFGFYEGMPIKVIRQIALGGPWVIQADTLYMALRDDEFALLEME